MHNCVVSIKELVDLLGGSVEYYLNGGCYKFAEAFIDMYGGTMRYLVTECHVVVELNGKLYDSSGNVTNKYSSSKYISGEELKGRSKILRQLGG